MYNIHTQGKGLVQTLEFLETVRCVQRFELKIQGRNV